MTTNNTGAGLSNPSRRNFLAATGATVASLNTAACIRKPREVILPYAKRPEDLVPGTPRHYATAMAVGETVLGLLVRSNDGRPTKVDGNPEHPLSRGASSVWAQASVLGLYAPERARYTYQGTEPVHASDRDAALKGLAGTLKGNRGKGLAVVIDETPSPTAYRLLEELKTAYPEARLFRSDGAGDANARAGAAMVGATDAAWVPFGEPRVLAVFDGDPLSTEGDAVAFNRLFAAGRSPELEDRANRLYVVEPNLSVTGTNADHRLAMPSSQVAEVLAGVSENLRSAGLDLPSMKVSDAVKNLPFVKALAKDLRSRPAGSTLVVVGERQAPAVHGLGLVINAALGNVGSTLRFTQRARPAAESLSELVAAVDDGSVETLIVLGGNPVYDAPGDLPVAGAIGKVKQSLYLGPTRDETATVSQWHIPLSHYLESWGDLVARDGTVSLVQPLISPLYESLSAIEVLDRLLGRSRSGYDIVRETYGALPEAGEKAWSRWLHDGVVAEAKAESVVPTFDATLLASAYPAVSKGDGLEVAFVRDVSVLDGRFASSPWLQEFPDPVTKLTWDNAAFISAATAAKLGVQTERMLSVSVDGRTVTLPAYIQPGTADDVVVLPLGYGRADGSDYGASGFAVGSLRMAGKPDYATGAKVSAASGTYPLASAQPETSMHGRPLVRSATRTDFTEEPNFVSSFEVIDESHVDTLLWEEPNAKDGHQWGMTIDLNSCTGCGSCTVACQAENNIPWVGKDDVMIGREMHWIRVDRYFDEEAGDIEFNMQPVACAHCETAPCENVCPVGATVHSPSGMNDMAYNRCIGTRYCANNCPYKVRRFNFFHYTVRNDQSYGMGVAMQRNPDVTVRYRGVMEKCTYCVQRVNRARIHAKVYRDGVIRDGEVVTACQEACPAQAITFGNLNDQESDIVKKKADPRNYALIAELNIRPRTTYLAALTNPNPELRGA